MPDVFWENMNKTGGAQLVDALNKSINTDADSSQFEDSMTNLINITSGLATATPRVTDSGASPASSSTASSRSMTPSVSIVDSPTATSTAPSPVATPQETTMADASGDTNMGAIIGITAVVLVIVAATVAVVLVKRRRRRQLSKDSGSAADEPPFSTMSSNASKESAGNSSLFDPNGIWSDAAIATVRVPLEKITIQHVISRGGFGEVCLGFYQDQRVAVKRLLQEKRRDLAQIQAFLAEVKLMASLEHEHVVRFVGVAWDSLSDLCVLSEFVEGGDLRSVLDGFEREKSQPSGFNALKLQVAFHIAHALTYLHSLRPVVLHRDLKSRNVLLDSHMNAKLTDFGVARERSDRTMTAGVGSAMWMAPEVMLGGRYDHKADVFSFGVVLAELDTHLPPYNHAVEPETGRKLPEAAILQMISLGKLTVLFSDEAARTSQLGRRCVALDAATRPTAAQALYEVHQILRDEEER